AGGAASCLGYAGCNFLRQRLVLATLSGRPLKIRKIRAKEEDPGLRDFEASFIRLIDKVTNGSRIEINQTGTSLYYQPGLLYGGSLEHECSPSRSIGYYLEGLLCLAPFMKHPLKIVLRGVTNDQVDPSVDVLKATALPLLKKFGIDGEIPLEIKVEEVLLLHKDKSTNYCCRQLPFTNRTAHVVNVLFRGFFSSFFSCGFYTVFVMNLLSLSPGFGMCLTAETINGTILSAELASNPQGQGAAVLPEELGQNCAKLLLEEVYR
ncbi:RCL1 protein, partial [Phaetusa simplex]|nr:RCL1 protein [Phaetusa simplex]